MTASIQRMRGADGGLTPERGGRTIRAMRSFTLVMHAVVGCLSLGACGRPEATTSAPAEPTASATPDPQVAAPAPSDPAPDPAAAKPGLPGSDGPPAAAASPPVAAGPVVLESRWPFVGKVFRVSADGGVTREYTGPMVRPSERGSVPAASVEALHATLRAANFCALGPRRRESAPSNTVIQASYEDIACTVDLPDSRWRSIKAARQVMEAVQRVESEAFPASPGI